ncbi:RRQRL motif-containing zinc-binding protein [Nocardia wallacei]|uniref:RRQRL motif-containing zinc-binding protein n=1 Tax=Nocardia wallacei TaxID=480035 RepID=UPI0024581770|nr:RRQRL motif-containing zinc-binding protein [Nocardia wallacei]
MPPLDTGSAERDVYDWRTAPAHLMTRRQLRAAGLRPGGQQPVAWVPVEWRGRTQLAGLYDSRRAAPKRIATPAQLRAVAKAIREHQARAAERRGYSRAELSRVGDPGPGWAPTPDTTKEGNRMSDTEIGITARTEAAQLDYELAEAQHAAEVWAVDADGNTVQAAPSNDAMEAILVAQDRLDAHLHTHRDVLGDEPRWRSYYNNLDQAARPTTTAPDAPAEPAPAPAAMPTSRGQRVTYLLATVAVNQARERRDRLAADAAHAEGRGSEAVAWHRAARAKSRAAAEARLVTSTALLGPASVAPLADALVWHQDSHVAAERLTEITTAYGAGWGVVVDPDRLAVTIDPDVDAVVVQDYTDAAALRARDAAAVDAVTALPLPEQAQAHVSTAVTAWFYGEDIDPANPRAYLDSDTERRARLTADLAGLSDDDRSRVEFVVDYLRADTKDVDLLTTPVFVDPGVEARSRVPQLLETFSRNPKSGPEIAKEISVMTPDDQQRVRQAGKAIAAGQPVDTQLWPGYVNRDALAEELYLYAIDAEELHADADYLPQTVTEGVDNPELWGISDDTAGRIARLATRREELLAQTAGGEGLAAMERAQFEATLGDLDAGLRTSKQLPELLWADERTKAEVDHMRDSARGGELAAATREAVTQRLAAAGVDIDARDHGRLRGALDRIGTSVSSVASGAGSTGMDYERKAYVDHRTALGQALARADVDQAARAEIRGIIDGRAREAGELGQVAAERRDRWKAKTDHVVARRDDAIAQQRAATAGRTKPPDQQRACTARVDLTQPGVSSPSPAGMRQLHSMEVER